MTRSESGFATGMDLGDESRGEERGLLTVGTSLMLNSTVRPTAAVIIIIHSFSSSSRRGIFTRHSPR